MNLWLRLAWLLLTAWRRPRLAVPEQASVLHFRVWPQDLDPSLHMNNGRYLALMDLGRLDLLLRSGMWRPVRRHGWTPVAGAIAIRFRRELRCWRRFRLETRLLCWDGVAAVMEQQLVHESGAQKGQVAARALFRGGFYDRRAKRFVTTQRVMRELGVTAASPPATPEVIAFLAAEEALRP